MVKYLLGVNANPASRDSAGQNLLHVVARRCVTGSYVTELVELLHERKQLVTLLSTRNNAGLRPLDVALCRGLRTMGHYRQRITTGQHADRHSDRKPASQLMDLVRLLYAHTPRVNTFWDDGTAEGEKYFHANTAVSDGSEGSKSSDNNGATNQQKSDEAAKTVAAGAPSRRTVRFLSHLPPWVQYADVELSATGQAQLSQRWLMVQREYQFLGDVFEATRAADVQRILEIMPSASQDPLQLFMLPNFYITLTWPEGHPERLAFLHNDRCYTLIPKPTDNTSQQYVDVTELTKADNPSLQYWIKLSGTDTPMVLEPAKRRHHWTILHEAVSAKSARHAMASFKAVYDALVPGDPALAPGFFLGLLKQQEENLSRTPLMIAAAMGHFEVVSECLVFARQRDPQLVGELLQQRDALLRNAGMVALSRNHAKLALALFEACPDSRNQTDKLGRTPLYYACEGGFLEVVKVLLKGDKQCPWIRTSAGMFIPNNAARDSQ